MVGDGRVPLQGTLRRWGCPSRLPVHPLTAAQFHSLWDNPPVVRAIARSSGDGRTAFTIRAFFQVLIGEPKFRSENAYPGVDAPDRDIRPSVSHFLRPS